MMVIVIVYRFIDVLFWAAEESATIQVVLSLSQVGKDGTITVFLGPKMELLTAAPAVWTKVRR